MKLTPAEGFLLSRIDGQTPWRLLREIGGLPPEGVDDRLARWESEGLVVFAGGSASSTKTDACAANARATRPPKASRPSASRRKKPSAARATRKKKNAKSTGEFPDGFDTDVDENLLHEGLDLDLAVQRRILVYDANLGLSPRTLLGVEADADAKTLKRAYFKLSKDFHPDRFFRREIGDYGERLHRIFKKVMAAYEILCDPNAPPEALMAATPAGEPEPSEVEPEKVGLTRIEKLRQRMPFPQINSEAREAKRAQANELFKAAEMSLRIGNRSEAANTVKVGLSFDPTHLGLRKLSKQMKRDILTGQLEDAQRTENHAGAFEASEALLKLSLDDQELRVATAELAALAGRPDRARALAEEAGRAIGETAEIYRVLALAHLENGEPGHALKQAQRALELDANDEKVKALISALKNRSPRRAGTGSRTGSGGSGGQG